MGGEIIGNIDVAQVTLYVFWLFFAALIFYLHREGKREGFPLQADDGELSSGGEGFPELPPAKTFLMRDGSTVSVPGDNHGYQPTNARKVAKFVGAPIEPTGNPLLAGVGPGAWAERADHPDLTMDGDVKIVPLRAAAGFSVSANDRNPIGSQVTGACGGVAGTVKDLWVDKAEMIIRFYEVTLSDGMTTVLVPESFIGLKGSKVSVSAITAAQFADVPKLANSEQVTMLEEERIMAYFGAGLLYATPDRQEPLLEPWL